MGTNSGYKYRFARVRLESGGSYRSATGRGPVHRFDIPGGGRLIRQKAAAPAPRLYSSPMAVQFGGWEWMVATMDAGKSTTYDSFGGTKCDDSNHPMAMGALGRWGWMDVHTGWAEVNTNKLCEALALGTDYGWGTKVVAGPWHSCDTKTGKSKGGGYLNTQSCNDPWKYGRNSNYFKAHGCNPGYGNCRHVD